MCYCGCINEDYFGECRKRGYKCPILEEDAEKEEEEEDESE